ncbi:MAG: radical SAM protein [Candidatus Alcyoniella australis]|nr:radical SAM protein [Candidatus Alcyoniella australis]
MKVLFVYFNVATGNGPHYNHGIGSLSAVLNEHGHRPGLVTVEQTDFDLAPELEDFRPDIVCLSFNSHQRSFALRAAQQIKKTLPDALLIAGGVHATHAPQDVIDWPQIDVLVRGEGEGALVDLAGALRQGRPYDSIDNLWLRKDGEVIRNPLRPLIRDLDDLPLADRSIFDMQRILQVNAYEMPMMAGRGCPMHCTYCCNHALSRLYKDKGSYVRFRSVGNILEEIERLQRQYRIDTLYFEDDIFTIKSRFAVDFAEAYRRRFLIPFRIYVRVEMVTRELLATLKRAGLYMVNIGVESGSERIRREVMKRPMSNEQIELVFQWCRELEIITRDFNIVGVPGDDEQTIRETIELNQRVLPDQIQVSIFYPYPGTQLFDQCVEQGLYSGEERTTYFENESVLELPTISRQRITELYQEFCDEARAIEARKEQVDMQRGRQGYFDFVSEFSRAQRRRGDDEMVRLDRFLINGDRRFVLFMHPRSALVYPQVEIRPDSRLQLAMALDPKCLEWGGRGVHYRVRLERGDEKIVVFNDFIDPKNKAIDRGWQEREVALNNFPGTWDVVFMTDPDRTGDLTGAWSGWGRPYLEGGA